MAAGGAERERVMGGKGGRHMLGMDSKTYAVAIKCYDEQLQAGAAGDTDGLYSRIRSVDPSKYQVLAIRHDRDTVTDGIWAMSTVKPHYHIILRCASRKTRVKVATVLNMLGICFRQGVDDGLWKEHGVETVGSFDGYAMYLTHETEEAIKDCKEPYEESEIVSNLAPDGVRAVREGYIRVSAKEAVTMDTLAALDREAYGIGHDLGDFDGWYGALPFAVRAHAKMRTIRESYNRGVDDRISERAAVTRLCVFVQGPPNSGKTHAARSALMDRRPICISGGGTGKFDSLRPDHGAIILDDCTCENLVNMTDNYICRAYRRNSDNPAWAGTYLIVTSNLPFEDWVAACGVVVHERWGAYTEEYEAIRSRFYICGIRTEGGVPHLSMESASMRGTSEDIRTRHGMFEAFAARYDASLAAYHEASRADAIDIEDMARGEHSRYWDDMEAAHARWAAEQADREAELYDIWEAQQEEKSCPACGAGQPERKYDPSEDPERSYY